MGWVTEQQTDIISLFAPWHHLDEISFQSSFWKKIALQRRPHRGRGGSVCVGVCVCTYTNMNEQTSSLAVWTPLPFRPPCSSAQSHHQGLSHPRYYRGFFPAQNLARERDFSYFFPDTGQNCRCVRNGSSWMAWILFGPWGPMQFAQLHRLCA